MAFVCRESLYEAGDALMLVDIPEDFLNLHLFGHVVTPECPMARIARIEGRMLLKAPFFSVLHYRALPAACQENDPACANISLTQKITPHILRGKHLHNFCA